jgi:hypothetical protein
LETGPPPPRAGQSTLSQMLENIDRTGSAVIFRQLWTYYPHPWFHSLLINRNKQTSGLTIIVHGANQTFIAKLRFLVKNHKHGVSMCLSSGPPAIAGLSCPVRPHLSYSLWAGLQSAAFTSRGQGLATLLNVHAVQTPPA